MVTPTKCPTPDGRCLLEENIVITLAGNVAGRRCLQGSAPGWCRRRTWDEVKSFHEAGHAVVRGLFGRRNWHVDVEEIPGVRGGLSWGAPAAEPQAPAPGPVPLEKSDSDLRSAAKLCYVIATGNLIAAGCSDFTGMCPHGTWKRALGIYRRLKAQTESLVQENWPEITRLASALLDRKTLDEESIGKVLTGLPLCTERPTRTAAMDVADARLRERGRARLQELLALQKKTTAT